MPIASSSRVSPTSVVSGAASAILIKWTSHVSGKAETIFTPDRFKPLYTILEFSTETGTAADCSTNTYNVDETGAFPSSRGGEYDAHTEQFRATEIDK